MKCKDCAIFGCQYRTTDAEKDCYYEQWTAKQFDWQSFRNQAAKDILCAMISSTTYFFAESTIDSRTDRAIRFADNLISKLKEKEEK